MNIEKLKSSFTIEQHLIIELILCLIIAFLFLKPAPSIKVSSKGFPRDVALIFQLEFGGKINVLPRDGENTTIKPAQGRPRSPLKLLDSFGVAITKDSIGNTSSSKQFGFIDSIISPAMASMHDLTGHDYLNFPWSLGRASGCNRYDITNYPSAPPIFVGPCI